MIFRFKISSLTGSWYLHLVCVSALMKLFTEHHEKGSISHTQVGVIYCISLAGEIYYTVPAWKWVIVNGPGCLNQQAYQFTKLI